MGKILDFRERASHEHETIMTLLTEAHRQSCHGEAIVPAVYELVDVALDRTLELLSAHAPDLRPAFVIRADALRRETEHQRIMDETQAHDRDDSRLKLIQHLGRFAFDLDSALGRPPRCHA